MGPGQGRGWSTQEEAGLGAAHTGARFFPTEEGEVGGFEELVLVTSAAVLWSGRFLCLGADRFCGVQVVHESSATSGESGLPLH